MKKVVIIIPHHKAELSLAQRISLCHWEKYLQAYDTYFVLPEGCKITHPVINTRHFSAKHFSSEAAYTKFMLSSEPYEAFQDYEYMLIYQLDCLVFSDQLITWCHLGYDYIGAPWLKSLSNPELGFSRTGNGGLCLRKIESCLQVLYSQKYKKGAHPSYLWDLFFTSLPDMHLRSHLNYWQKYWRKLEILKSIRVGVTDYIATYDRLEDCFWSDRAVLFDPKFTIAPVDVALKFAFECAPQYCFERNHRMLPFGAHAWEKWDRTFWEPYLLTETESKTL